MREVAFLKSMREHVQKNLPPISLENAESRGLPVSIENDPYKKTFLTSALAHFTFLILALIVPQILQMVGVGPSYQEKFKKKEFKNAIRVDLVGLPTKKLIDLQKVDPTEAVGKKVEEAPAPPAPSESAMILPDEQKKVEEAKAKELQNQKLKLKQESVAEKKKKRLSELRASMKIEQRRKEMLKELSEGEVADTGREILAGNIVSQGYSVTGDVASDMDVYQGHLKVHIRKSWNLPGWMQASNLSAKVLVKFAPNGRILSQVFLKNSGNSEFDSHVLRAIKEAEPFPKPPPSLEREVMEEGVELGYPQ